MNKPTCEELYQMYENAQEIICDLRIEISELKQERDDYIQDYSETEEVLINHGIL